jgi:hypothetical protein
VGSERYVSRQDADREREVILDGISTFQSMCRGALLDVGVKKLGHKARLMLASGCIPDQART